MSHSFGSRILMLGCSAALWSMTGCYFDQVSKDNTPEASDLAGSGLDPETDPPVPTPVDAVDRTEPGQAVGVVEPTDVDGPGVTYGTQSLGATKANLSRLTSANSCEELLYQLKSQAIQTAEKTADANLQAVIQMTERHTGCPQYEVLIAIDGGGGPAPIDEGGPDSESQHASEYSTTNTQVAGVDEADFIKNDGSYIYVVADGSLHIVDAWPPEQAHELTAIDIEGSPKKLYVHEDIAVVYSSLESLQGQADSYDMSRFRNWGDSADRECTYGYDCAFSGDGHALKITVYDISDKASPVLLRETEFSGSYLSSRRIDNAIHTVVVFPERSLPGIESYPQPIIEHFESCDEEYAEFPFAREELFPMFDELKRQNRRRIEEASLADFLPGMKDTRYDDGHAAGTETLLAGCDDLYLSQAGDGSSYLSIVSFEMDALDEMTAATITGKPGAVYASEDALYVAVPHYSASMDDWYFYADSQHREATALHKFALTSDPLGAAYLASGVTKGRILNQFSMDEHAGYLRVATTTGRVPDPEVHSTLSVFEEYHGSLRVVGMIDNIAPTEDIRSVRFDGDIGFIVTFKKTDPLFVLDLSRPEYPVIKAALKIPGFSTYMHLMDDTHLLTMGYDAEDHGSYALFQGIQLQIIDIGNMEDPVLVHKEVIGTRGSTSDAATNHLAFNYFPERDLLAIPMTICERSRGLAGSGGGYGDLMTFGGLLVYQVTARDGFVSLGGVPHETPETEVAFPSSCSNWWTESNSKVKRSIFMSDSGHDFVFSVAPDLINVSNLDDLEHPLASIELM